VVLILKKRLTAAALALTLLTLGAPVSRALGAPENSAACAILTDAASGETLYEKHADKLMRIASTTKIMTALVVLEHCALSEEVTIERGWTGVEGSSMYLAEGETMTVEDLLYGLLLASGNDAAVALACHTAGSVEAFAELMNERARSLGLISTSFRNPHGLDEEGHYSTARDLAAITRAAMENETFARIVSTSETEAAGRQLQNHNRLLREYEGAVGVKTGYTKSAGRILVSCAEREGLRLICVTIADPDDWNDHKGLYDWAFGTFYRTDALGPDAMAFEIPVISGAAPAVTVRAERDFSLLLTRDDTLSLRTEAPKFVYAGVTAGDEAGRVIVSKNGERLGTVVLRYGSSVPVDETQKLSAAGRFLRALFGD